MKLFAESLMSELEHQLKLIHLETENPVHSAELAIKNSVATLERLKTQLFDVSQPRTSIFYLNPKIRGSKLTI